MKQLILILVLWVCATSAMAQEMRSIFVNLPDSIEPLLTKVNREDCIDFLDSDMKALVKNRFDRTAELKELTKDYLQMQLSGSLIPHGTNWTLPNSSACPPKICSICPRIR